jgi:hypothetical protein
MNHAGSRCHHRRARRFSTLLTSRNTNHTSFAPAFLSRQNARVLCTIISRQVPLRFIGTMGPSRARQRSFRASSRGVISWRAGGACHTQPGPTGPCCVCSLVHLQSQTNPNLNLNLRTAGLCGCFEMSMVRGCGWVSKMPHSAAVGAGCIWQDLSAISIPHAHAS